MCGLNGLVYADPQRSITEDRLLAMRDSMRHRGPDDAGTYLAPGVALGSRRLAILDLSERGRMPMSSPDGRYRIVYNGEVYNYRELRDALEARGHAFHSGTDTEVLLALYAREGPAMLERLNGMFAMAIWDREERALFLARDRLGVKPLYYAVGDGVLAFASEEKALFASGLPAEFDPATWSELLCFRYVAGDRTPYKGVRRLLAGHYLLWRRGAVTLRRWWHLGKRARELRDDLPDDPLEWFRETFDSAVRLRRISDVPVGVLLSGGLDSGSVAASLAMQAGEGLASFTVRFAEKSFDEGDLARTVIDRYRLEAHEMTVGPRDLLHGLIEASWFNDEPLAHGNDPHLLAISKLAKPRVTVLLSGEGADETLGGYVRYRPLRLSGLLGAARRALPPLVRALGVGGRLGKLARFLEAGSVDQFVLFNACEVLPNDLRDLGLEVREPFSYRLAVLEEAKDLYPADAMRQAMYSDQHTFLASVLDRNDRMTMGASIECRVPFLDYRLVEGVAALPSRLLLRGWRGKQLMRDAIGSRLPAPIRRHRKWGFGVPWNRYLREVPEWRERVAALPGRPPILGGPFDRGRLEGMIARFLEGREGQEALIRQLLMISVWYEACIVGSPRAVEPDPAARLI